jgi:hypothetical protein
MTFGQVAHGSRHFTALFLSAAVWRRQVNLLEVQSSGRQRRGHRVGSHGGSRDRFGGRRCRVAPSGGKETPERLDECGEGRLIGLQDVIAAIQWNESPVGDQRVQLLGLGKGPYQVVALCRISVGTSSVRAASAASSDPKARHSRCAFLADVVRRCSSSNARQTSSGPSGRNRASYTCRNPGWSDPHDSRIS